MPNFIPRGCKIKKINHQPTINGDADGDGQIAMVGHCLSIVFFSLEIPSKSGDRSFELEKYCGHFFVGVEPFPKRGPHVFALSMPKNAQTCEPTLL